MGRTINIEDVCSPADIPQLVSVANITGVDMSAEEGFLLSRIDGHTPVSGVLQLSSFDDDKTLALLASLYSKGLINFTKKDGGVGWDEFRSKKATPRASSSGAAAAGNGEDTGSSPLDRRREDMVVEEVPDLTREQCVTILKLHKQVTEARNPYEILAVKHNVQEKALKKQHRQMAKDFHPDRFFRKDIGPYRHMIATIFGISHEAYEILTDPDRRKTLDAELKLEEYKRQRLEDKKKQVERDNRPSRPKPAESIWARKLKEGLKGRIVKAKRHYEKAKQDFKDKKYVSASSNIQLAMTYDPWNEDYPKFHDEIRPTVAEAVYKESMRRGRGHESMIEFGLAMVEYERALAQKPEDPDACWHLGKCIMRAEGDARRARELLQKASMAEPQNIERLLLLAEAYIIVKMYKNALRTFERVKKLERKNEQALDGIKRVKKLM